MHCLPGRAFVILCCQSCKAGGVLPARSRLSAGARPEMPVTGAGSGDALPAGPHSGKLKRREQDDSIAELTGIIAGDLMNPVQLILERILMNIQRFGGFL